MKIYRVHIHDHADQGRWLAQQDFSKRPTREQIDAAFPLLAEPGRYEVRLLLVQGETEQLASSWLQGEFVKDPANPTDAELAAAVQRGLKSGQLVDASEWLARQTPQAGAVCQSCGCIHPTTHIVQRASGFTAGWFGGPDAAQQAADFAAECNREVPGDPASVEELDFGPLEELGREARPDGCICEVPPTEPGNALIMNWACIVHGNADGNPYVPYTPEHRVWNLAQENGKAAASRVFDGNTTMATYRRFLAGIRDGDPEVMDSVRTPSLSGEYGDDYSEDELMADAGWVPHDGTDLRDELASQYNTDVSAAFWAEVERMARDQAEPVTSVPELDDRMEPEHVIRVLDEGRVTDAEGSYAPELIMFVDDDGQALPDSDDDLQNQARSAGWRLLTGWTGQYAYRGPVMHPSEFVGGALARHILDTPGEYVAVVVETDDDDDEPAGWAVAYRETPEA